MRSHYVVRYDESLGIDVKKCSKCHTEKPVSEFYIPKSGIHSRCKVCEKVAYKARYDANPEKYRAVSREYAYQHPEEHRARRQRWGEANKEYCLQYYREYNEVHRNERRAYDRIRHSKETPEFRHMWYERRREYFLRYVEANKERMAEIGRNWHKRFPEKHAATQSRRRAHKSNAPRIEKIDYQALIERDNWTCYLCGQICAPINVTLDHVVPLIHNGSHTVDNLRVACRSCNCRKGAKYLKDFLK